MYGLRSRLCWLAAGLLLCSLSALAKGRQAGKGCVPPADPSTRVGLRGYQRFHANDSLIGHPVPCTRDDKICFRHNLIFYPNADRCDAIGQVYPDCAANAECYCKLRVNRAELEHGSGRLVGFCPKYADPCARSAYRMAYDGTCYRKEIVHNVICGCEATPTDHILGDTECREDPTTPISVQQPDEDGHCVIPDLRNPDSRSIFFRNPLESIQGSRNGDAVPSLDCDPPQARCFDLGKIWISGFEGCHSLLEQGPCADDHIVVLDAEAAIRGSAEGTCVHVRGGCPPGYKRMLFDGKCHEDREVRIEAPGIIILNQYGSYFVIGRFEMMVFVPTLADKRFCVINIGIQRPHISVGIPKPPCGAEDTGGCNRYEVENDSPEPEL